MSYFTPKISKTKTDEREEDSIAVIEDILRHTATKTHLQKADKVANVDGSIELLGDDNRLVGRITVQVKTIQPTDEGKWKYPCPTSLLGYAENTLEIVILLAVDHSTNTVLWKHISRSLIEQNIAKCAQESITLHFHGNEKLTKSNVNEVIGVWKTIAKKEIELYNTLPALTKSNEKLRDYIVKYDSHVSIPPEHWELIQKCSDFYNNNLDTSFNYIKRLLYSDVWKRGIAIFEFSDTDLSYSLFSIKYGENSLLIKELPIELIGNVNHDLISRCSVENLLLKSPIELAINLLKRDVDYFLEKHKTLPLCVETAMEYITDFLCEYKSNLKLSENTDFNKLQSILDEIEKSYPYVKEDIPVIIKSSREVHLNIFYKCLIYLIYNGEDKIRQVYPQREFGHIVKGWVYETFSLHNAYQKIQKVLSMSFNLYLDFISSNFPLIYDELDLFYGCDLMCINISGADYQETYASIYYFKSNSMRTNKDVLYSLNMDSTLFVENNIRESNDLWKSSIKYGGREYNLYRSEGIDVHMLLYDKYNIINTFYNILTTRFKEYFEKQFKVLHNN